VALVARRAIVGVLLVLILSVLVFAGTQVLPGDAASAVLGRNARPDAVQQVRAELGLDRSIFAQYGDWISGLLSGDLGTSLASHRPVSELIGDRIANTAVLALLTIMILVPLAVALGVVAGVRRGRMSDHVISGVTLAAIALPEFVAGSLLVVLLAGTVLDILPPVSLVGPGESPLGHPDVLVLPVLTLLVVGLAYTVRMVRAGVAEAMGSEYVEAARLNGIPEARLIRRHVLPNALATTVTTVALTTQWLVGGAVVVETVFQYPGLGQALVQAVAVRDIPTVQAIAMIIAIFYIAVNILADVIVILLIPKQRTSL
jgi:peptide/nickel transport system permease protein